MKRLLLACCVGCLLGLAARADAAFPQIATTNTSVNNSSGTSHTVSLPASISAGDTLLVFIGHEAGSGATNWSASGWTELGYSHRGGAVGLHVFYKEATGSEGATVVFSSGSDSTVSAHNSVRITGAEDPETQAPEISGFNSGESLWPDPPTVTPTGGAKDYLYLAVAANEDGTTTISSYPSGYSGGIEANGDGSNVTTASAYLQENSSSENPGAYVLTGVEHHIACTVAVHPASAPAAVPKMTLLGIGP